MAKTRNDDVCAPYQPEAPARELGLVGKTGNDDVRARLDDILSRRIMVLDGSMGALIYSYQLTEEDVRGNRFARHPYAIKNCTEALVLTRPDVIEQIHRAYLEAGADIIETDTFNGTAVSLEEFGLQEHVFEINKTAAELARRAADEFTRRNPAKPRFVAGSIGPTKKQLSMGIHVEDPGRRDATFDEMVACYREQITALVAGGVDILLPETSFDTLVMKACLFAIDAFFEETGRRLPVMISGTIFDNGRTLSAQPIEAFYYSVSHFDALSVGLNCAVGVDLMRDSIESLAAICRTRVSCYPNAGMPDGFGGFLGDKDHTAAVLGEFARSGWLNIVGGCCGTTPEWTAAIAQAVEGVAPRRLPEIPHWSNYSGMEPLLVRPETNFIMIGERTNITGSKRFARLIKSGDYEAALAVARDQVEGGANILDVNMDEGLIDGPQAMTRFLNLVSADPAIARVPVMIDSSNFSVIEAGLKCVQGKSLVNSISLKGGEDEFLRQARLCRRYGAAVIVMAFDEQGQAVTKDHKVAICLRAYQLLTEKAGFPPEDIVFDANILTVGTGIEEHNNYAVEFIEAVRELKRILPYCKTSGGVSNVSFSYRGNDVVREAMNAAFLYHAIAAGLDMGIVNAGQLVVYEEIPARSPGAGRGRAVEPPAGRCRPPHRICRVGQGVARQGQGQRTGLARAAGGRAAQARAGDRHDRLHRGRHRGGQAAVRPAAPHHRRAAHGRHECGRRPLRCGQDVPASSRQKRAGDEEGGRLPDAVHGSRESRRSGRRRQRSSRRECRSRAQESRPGFDGHRQGRRPRHRQEHRRRGAGVQRLRYRRLGRHGPLRRDLEASPRAPGRHDRALGVDHSLARRDGARREVDGARRVPGAALDRRRDHERPPHGRQDRASIPRYGDPRQRCFQERERGRAIEPARSRAELDLQNRATQERERLAFGQRVARKLVPYAEAARQRFRIEWDNSPIAVPSFLGARTLRAIPLEEIVPYIDWSPFFLAWELKGKYPRIFDDARLGGRARELFDDAQKLLRQIVSDRLVTANAVYGFFPANAEGDDIVIYTDESRGTERTCASPRSGSSGSATARLRSVRWPITSRPDRPESPITWAPSP